MDYIVLLRKYVQHVFQCEGTTFIDAIHDRASGTEVRFTPEEVQVLETLDKLPRWD